MATSGVRGTNRRCEGTSAQCDREIGTLRPMETKSRATLIESLDLPRVALGPWGSLVYPWWFGTTRLRFKSGRTHSFGVRTSVSRPSLFEWGRGVGACGGIRGRPKPVRSRQVRPHHAWRTRTPGPLPDEDHPYEELTVMLPTMPAL